ncbi:MAG: hypothetical protein IJ849_05955 [Selenomonadaceae bacterium]|nr:hypothetical protein [Selenomonadaceae bacterium]
MWRRIILLGWLCWLVTISVEGAPLVVAQYPWQEQGGRVPTRVLDYLETRLDRALHVPLNGFLGRVSYLSDDDCERAWAETLAEAAPVQGHKARLKDLMKPLADKLGADLVVYPVVERYAEYQGMGWRFDRGPILHSWVTLRLVGYDRRRDEVFNKSVTRSYSDEYSSSGTAASLAQECLERVLTATALHARISDKGE